MLLDIVQIDNYLSQKLRSIYASYCPVTEWDKKYLNVVMASLDMDSLFTLQDVHSAADFKVLVCGL